MKNQKIYFNKNKPASLVYFEAGEKPRQYVLFHESLISGQNAAEIFTPGMLELTYPYLDREQWEIFIKDGAWKICAISGRGTTLVDGNVLRAGEEAALTDRSVIQLVSEKVLTLVFFEKYTGGMEYAFTTGKAQHPWPVVVPVRASVPGFAPGFLYGYPTEKEKLSIRIDERSSFRSLQKVSLLKNIFVTLTPGKMVLVLGGSGTGKSTFVNAVTGYEKAKGSVREGDLDYYSGGDRVRHRVGFVPQENLIREVDTVGGVMYGAAETRLPRDLPAEEKQRRIEASLETFGLTGKEREIVGKLSGGEKKRLSICMEYIAAPSVFILDEPDSGLDGSMALELMENLLLAAAKGHTVLVITHSPDRVEHLFDEVIVLARDEEESVGHLAFFGTVDDAKAYFEVPSLEGIVRLLNRRNEGGAGLADTYIRKYQDEHPERVPKEDASGEFKPEKDRTSGAAEKKEEGWEDVRYKNTLQQIPVYLKKQFRLMVTEKNWKILLMALLISSLVIYVLGKDMFRSMEGTRYCSLALISVCIWNGMFNSIQAVCKERKIIKREHRAGMHIMAYIAAHTIYQAALCLVQVVLELVVFAVVGMYMPERGLITGVFLLDLGITMFLVTFAADMMALMVSCMVHSTTTAMTLMPFLLLVQLVFSGPAFPLNKAGAKAVSHLTVSNWGINAICTAADYNHLDSTAILRTLNSMHDEAGDGNRIASTIKGILGSKYVREWIQTFSATKLQVDDFEYTPGNLLRSWGVLLLFALCYIGAGAFSLSFVDYDTR
ncbi:MAG: ATP-binding cassette domain-containing protein [Lachnospiraceae bacterium]|nr:ATP-binding cassette domain-containing protein [Lachnospiraceae bacterium]